MKANDTYVDLDGNVILLAELDAEERRLVAALRRRARTNPDWDAFDNYWTRVVPEFYRARGVGRKAILRKPVYRIAQDLSSRLGIAAGLIRPDDYRDELEDLIGENFPSRRAFCKATGLSEDVIGAVLAGRGDLSVTALSEALGRIGFRLAIVPAPEVKQAVSRRQPA
jgi:hypothetical protein